jgi:hypothetical protein
MAGVINNPERALLKPKVRFNIALDLIEQRTVRPRCIPHEMKQRLVFGRHVARIGFRSQRLYALALQRQHQTAAIFRQVLVARRITQPFAQTRHVTLEFCNNILRHELRPPAVRMPLSWQ